MPYEHNPEGTSDDFNSDNRADRGVNGHPEWCDCKSCNAHWARLEARAALRAR
jgi:hypothetical protein